MTENQIAKLIFDLSLQIHKQYGPGLFESVYEEILCFELSKYDVDFKRQRGIPVIHESIRLDDGFRADIIIENKVIIELKSVEKLSEIHHKQVLTYLKLSGCKLGLLINFNVVLLKDGFHRIVNGL